MPKAKRTVSPTTPKAEITLAGKTYRLLFTFEALALAEDKLRQLGVTVNLLQALDLSSLDATRFVPLLYAAMITNHPEVTPEQAAKMVTFRSYPEIYQAIGVAFLASLAEPDTDAVPPLDQAGE